MQTGRDINKQDNTEISSTLVLGCKHMKQDYPGQWKDIRQIYSPLVDNLMVCGSDEHTNIPLNTMADYVSQM